MTSLDERVSRLEGNYQNIDDRIQLQLDTLDHRMDGLDMKVGHLTEEFRDFHRWALAWSRSVDRRFDKLEKLIRDSHSGNGATPQS